MTSLKAQEQLKKIKTRLFSFARKMLEKVKSLDSWAPSTSPDSQGKRKERVPIPIKVL